MSYRRKLRSTLDLGRWVAYRAELALRVEGRELSGRLRDELEALAVAAYNVGRRRGRAEVARSIALRQGLDCALDTPLELPPHVVTAPQRIGGELERPSRDGALTPPNVMLVEPGEAGGPAPSYVRRELAEAVDRVNAFYGEGRSRRTVFGSRKP